MEDDSRRAPCSSRRVARMVAAAPCIGGRLMQDGTQRALQLKVGDQVLFGKHAGQTVKVDGEELLVTREEDVMGVLEADNVARKAA